MKKERSVIVYSVIPLSTLKIIEDFQKLHGLSRSASIRFMVNDYINNSL